MFFIFRFSKFPFIWILNKIIKTVVRAIKRYQVRQLVFYSILGRCHKTWRGCPNMEITLANTGSCCKQFIEQNLLCFSNTRKSSVHANFVEEVITQCGFFRANKLERN